MEVDVEVPSVEKSNTFTMDPSRSNPDAENKWREVLSLLGKRPSLEKKKMNILEARDALFQLELDRLLENL